MNTFSPNQMMMKHKLFNSLVILICIGLILPAKAFCQNSKKTVPAHKAKKLALDRAVMCEGIKDYAPYNAAVVFSINVGKVSCFTSFDPVPEKTFIYHKWYHRDRLSTNKRLTLQPPRWATFTSIQLRETDKGPWRVEIYDHKNRLLDTLRFSITD